MAGNQYKILLKYLPENTLDGILEIIINKPIKLIIKGQRKSKYGDYKPPIRNHYHCITINNNLNPYHFLITLVHEIAHLMTWEKYKNKVKPHGKEWKEIYKSLLTQFMDVFPMDIKIAVLQHLGNIKASTSADLKLTKALISYNQDQPLMISDIPPNSIFSIEDGRVFKKINKVRTRYRCYCLDDNRYYSMSAFYQIKDLSA